MPFSTSKILSERWGIPLEDLRREYSPLIDQMELGVLPEKEFWQQLSMRLRKDTPGDSFELLRKPVLGSQIYPEMTGFVQQLRQEMGLRVALLSNVTKLQTEVNIGRGA